jgi:hypothetical protein
MKRLLLLGLVLGLMCGAAWARQSLGYWRGFDRALLLQNGTFVGTVDALEKLRSGDVDAGTRRIEALYFSAANTVYSGWGASRSVAARKSMKGAVSAWGLGIATLVISIPNAFCSKKTLARNSKLIGTQNLVVARTLCVIGVFAGWFMVLVGVWLVFDYANGIFSALGLLTALVIAFFAYREARADTVKSAKANEHAKPKDKP